jgi:hypothetical protein
MPSSESTVPYVEDAHYYQRRKDDEELKLEGSPVIEPLEEPMPVLDMAAAFAELSSSSSFAELGDTQGDKTQPKELTLQKGAETQQLKATDLTKAKPGTDKSMEDLMEEISSDSDEAKPMKKASAGKLNFDLDETF